VTGVPYTIVGVVRDIHSSDIRSKPRREMYVVFNDPNTGDAGQAKLSVRVRGDPKRYASPSSESSSASRRGSRQRG